MCRMENYSSAPARESDETTKTIILLGYPEIEDHKIPPPPDLTNTGPVGKFECNFREAI